MFFLPPNALSSECAVCGLMPAACCLQGYLESCLLIRLLVCEQQQTRKLTIMPFHGPPLLEITPCLQLQWLDGRKGGMEGRQWVVGSEGSVTGDEREKQQQAFGSLGMGSHILVSFSSSIHGAQDLSRPRKNKTDDDPGPLCSPIQELTGEWASQTVKKLK